jgi:hypothetical protein
MREPTRKTYEFERCKVRLLEAVYEKEELSRRSQGSLDIKAKSLSPRSPEINAWLRATTRTHVAPTEKF